MELVARIMMFAGQIIVGSGVVLSIIQDKWEVAVLGIILIYCMKILEKLNK